MSSDSDDDDDLLGGPTFKTARQERAADKRRERGLAYLDSSIREEKKREALQESITKIKMETNLESNQDERLTQAETIAAESKQEKKRKNINNLEDHHHHANDNGKGGLASLALKDQLATAVDTAQTCTLGTRKVLGRGNAENQWSTVEFCLEALEDILKKVQADKNKDDKPFRNDVIALLKNKDTLEQVLMHRKLAQVCQKYEMVQLPYEIMEWLLCMACSPIDGDSSRLSVGAFQTLDTIWARTTTKQPLLTLKDILHDLKDWFDLKLNEASSAAEEMSTSIVSDVSVLGLEHFLRLWERVLSNNIVVLDKEPKETATQCIVALARASLDPCFYKCHGLLEALQRTIAALLSFVAKNVVTDQDELDNWIQVTATAVLDQCKTLSAETSFSGDDEMWLCLPLMARAVSTFEHCQSMFDEDIYRQFRAILAMQALQTCLEVNGDWNQHVKTTLEERGEMELPEYAATSLAWRAIASAYAAFLRIQSLGSAITKNGQRCLATIKLMTYCILAGISLHSSISVASIENSQQSQDSQEATSFLRSSREEASLLLRVLQVLETEGRQLASRVSCFSSDPNFSRAEYLLSCVRRYGDFVRDKARVRAGAPSGSPVSVQKSIQNYFGMSSPES